MRKNFGFKTFKTFNLKETMRNTPEDLTESFDNLEFIDTNTNAITCQEIERADQNL